MNVTRHPSSRRLAQAAITASLVLTACGGNGSDEPTGYYDDQLIMFHLSVEPGGSVDRTARLLGEWLPRFLGENVRVSYENMPGGGHVIGHNYFEHNVDRDGLTLAMSSGTPHSAWLYGVDSVEFDPAGWVPLGASPGASLWYASPGNSGINDIQDLIDGNHEPLFFAGQTPTGSDLARVWILHALDIDFTPIWGFEGRGPARVAFEQGEGNISSDTSVDDTVAAYIEDGTAIALFTTGVVQPDGSLARDPIWADVPHWGEVYEQMYGELPSGPMYDSYLTVIGVQQELGRMVYMHGDDPPEAIEEMQVAFATMAADPDFQAAWEEIQGPYPIVIGDDLEGLWRTILVDVDPAIIDFILDFAFETYGVDLREGD